MYMTTRNKSLSALSPKRLNLISVGNYNGTPVENRKFYKPYFA